MIHKMQLPKMENKKVWIGGYFNHYNAIVIFSAEPPKTKADDYWGNSNTDLYDLVDKNVSTLLCGCCGLEEFKSYFPGIDLSPLLNKHGNMKSVEPEVLIEATIKAYWNGPKLLNIDFSFDGYQ